jgi:hypothetical protein
MFYETKKRTIIKSIAWRLIATVNSFLVLVSAFTDEPIWNAIIMNVTGLFIYFFFERMCNIIPYGKVTNER